MTTVRRSIWREPRPIDVPPVSRRDWLVAAGLGVVAVVEGVFRSDLAWRPLVTVLALVVVTVLPWRREHPLTAALVGFGAAGALAVAQLLADTGDLGLSTMLVVMVLLYALVRWGSGREIVQGLSFVAVVAALGMYATSADPAEQFGGTAFLLLFVALAAAFRYRADLWRRGELQVRNQERLALARELHDTVAHHVSAIAVQAQAGRAVADRQPEQALQVLRAIEAEASRTLAEMRSMVRVLRDDDSVAYSPQSGVGDLRSLARADATPAVEVFVATSSELPHPVDAAIYRIAQEAVTNALRHARNATRVAVKVQQEGQVIRLLVSDDGLTDATAPTESGFGLTGMAERAELLGGTLKAGPDDGGWVVDARFPMRGPA